MGLFYYELHDKAINSDIFEEFLRELHYRMDYREYVIYFDSLPVHRSNVVKKVLEELKIKHIFSPPYSPEYNAIEFYFSPLKKKVKALRL